MLHRIILNIALLALCSQLWAQSQPGEYLDINNHHVRIHSSGTVGHDGFVSRQEVPAGSGKRTLSASHIWVDLHLSDQFRGLGAERYKLEGTRWNEGGFTLPNNAITNPHRVWKINRSEIEGHILNYSSASYQIPDAIEMWPANDYEFGMVPYEDLDNDSIYEPHDGEYPLIKGDQAILSVFSNQHSETLFNSIPGPGGYPLFSVFAMAYAFGCEGEPAVDNTFFVHYKVKNHHPGESELSAGIWADLDIGNPFDDFMASDVSRNMFYAYNGDQMDETNNGIVGYGSNPPAHGVLILRGLNKAPNGQDEQSLINGEGFNDGIVDNELIGLTGFMVHNSDSNSATGAPYISSEYINLMQSRWKDSTALSYGGSGYNSSATNALYMYPGDTDPNGYGVGGLSVPSWTEQTAGNVPGNRCGLGVMRSVGIFSNIVEFEIAHIYAEAQGNDDAVARLKDHADILIHAYENGGGLCDLSFALGSDEVSPAKSRTSLTVYPNPTANRLTVESTSDETIVVYALDGREMMRSNDKVIDCEHLQPGVYLLQQGGRTTRFIKQ